LFLTKISRAIAFPTAAKSKPMSVSLNNFSTEDLESWKEVCNLLLVISTLAVCIGVYFEKDRNPEDVKEFGEGLVFRGIAFEILFAASLWQIDSTVSNRQKTEIATLYKEVSDANARTACIEKAAAWRFLNEGQIRKLSVELKQSVPHAVRIIFISSDPESLTLASQFVGVLTSSGWYFTTDAVGFSTVAPFGVYVPNGTSVEVMLLQNAH
jgi:hypothetical protein